jgi:hypothetical protein
MCEATIRYEDFNGVGLGSNRPEAEIHIDENYNQKLPGSGLFNKNVKFRPCHDLLRMNNVTVVG